MQTKETSSSAKESATSDAATSTATTEPKKYETAGEIAHSCVPDCRADSRTAVTYFDAVDEVGPCGTKPTDEDEVIHVPAIVVSTCFQLDRCRVDTSTSGATIRLLRHGAAAG